MSSVEELKNKIKGLEERSREMHAEISSNSGELKKLRAKLAKVEGNVFYVYLVFVDGALRYIGKGKGDRFKHAVSGASSVPELNKDHFTGKYIEVRVAYGNYNLSEQQAIQLESDFIGTAHSNYNGSGEGLYNKAFPKKWSYWDMDFHEYSEFGISNNADKSGLYAYLSKMGLE